ncbi:MAG: hypothetical protein LC130_14100, partial [Bryobacterales bacterium]|nr:hypothetical protein [Bryobacterales bacterium]
TRDYRYGGACESYELVSNPYRGSAPDGWTVTRRDPSGRVVRVKTFDGAAQPEPWGDNTASTGMVTTAYDGSTATVTDQAGKVRAQDHDALGRLLQVTEAEAYTTIYGYDALDNLTSVDQSGRGRSFTYSSLSRLRTATNPESGTTSYTYDDAGNLVLKSDARGVKTCFGNWVGLACEAGLEGNGYDGLNRPRRKTYSDSTPAVVWGYDTCGRGRVCTVASADTTIGYGYDGLGRVSASTQTTAGAAYPFLYN